MPALRDQDTFIASESWVVDALNEALAVQNTITSVSDLAESSLQCANNNQCQSSPLEIQPLHSDTEPDAVEEQKEDEFVNILELVPKENVVEDIKTVFRYIKQLGSGMQHIFVFAQLVVLLHSHICCRSQL